MISPHHPDLNSSVSTAPSTGSSTSSEGEPLQDTDEGLYLHDSPNEERSSASTSALQDLVPSGRKDVVVEEAALQVGEDDDQIPGHQSNVERLLIPSWLSSRTPGVINTQGP